MHSAKGTDDGRQTPERPLTSRLASRFGRTSLRPRKRSLPLALLVAPPALLATLVVIAGPTAATTDTDGDGYTDAAEAFIGTDPLRDCNETTTANDETTDAWPPDFNDDTAVGIADIVLLRAAYGSTSGDGVYDRRFDLTADGGIDIADIVELRAVYGSACEPATPPPPPPPAGAFLETFDGDPAGPQSFYDAPGWDVSIQSRFDKDVVADMTNVQHGPNCGAPPATHVNNYYSGVVFQCKNHVMTAVNTGGYAAVYLTPNRMVDFSQGEATIRFDMSTLVTSTRDWTDLWITPFADNLQFPLPVEQPFLAGDPRNAIHVDGTRVKVVRNFEREGLSSQWWKGIEQVLARVNLAPSPTRRDTIEIKISRDHVSYCLPVADFCWTDQPIDPPLTWDKGIVQFGHHSYNPEKGGCPDGHDPSLAGTECHKPNTWHRDNVSISPAIPFTIIHSGRRFVEWNDANSTVSFEAPAPANSFLRFMTERDDYNTTEISLDGGLTWVKAHMQPAAKQVLKGSSVVSNRWHPIPQGTTSVMVRAGEGARNDWFAFDFRIWSLTPPAGGTAGAGNGAVLSAQAGGDSGGLSCEIPAVWQVEPPLAVQWLPQAVSRPQQEVPQAAGATGSPAPY